MHFKETIFKDDKHILKPEKFILKMKKINIEG